MVEYDKPLDLKVQKSNQYLYFNDKEHPLAVGNSGKVYLHRHLASLKLGRWLESSEVVHHIDEDKQNNEESNLEVMTASQHAYAHRGLGAKMICAECGVEFQKLTRKHCCSQKCWNQHRRKVVWPSKEELQRDMGILSWVAMGRKYGVSDNAVRKWARFYGILSCD